jgi:hypothetical protein
MKYGPDGKELWARAITSGGSDYAYSVCVDATGHITVVGLTAGSGLETFAAQYSTEGKLNWINKSTSDGNQSRAHAVAADKAGNTYMVGECKGEVSFDQVQIGAKNKYEVFLVKYNAAGKVEWVRNTAPSDSYETKGTCVTVDRQGKIYVAGGFTKAINISGKQGTGKGGADIFIAKFNAVGAIEWLKTYGGDKKDRISSIAVDSTGAIFATANFAGRTKIDNQEMIGERLMKLSATGGLMWQKPIGIPRTDYSINSHLVLGSGGAIYIAGHIYGAIPLLGMQSASCAGGSDLFLAKCNAQGEREWLLQAGGSGIDEGSAIATDAGGNVYATGIFNRKCTFGNQTIESVGKEDGIFVIKVK